MLKVPLSPKEIHILVQAIRIAMEAGGLEEFCKQAEINTIRERLQNVKG